MDAFWPHYLEHLQGVTIGLGAGYLALLFSWPLFLWIEKKSPVQPGVPGKNYRLNWAITFSNFILAPSFAAIVVISTVWIAGHTGLPSLELSTNRLGVGILPLDILIQGTLIFLAACFLGDLSYYWWHRAQHTIPFLWEMHKLHHSDENLNTTTIFRSHFLEPAGQALFRGLSIGLIFDVTSGPQTLLAAIAGGLMLGLWDFFIHANERIDALYRLPPFFSNPQFHWIHHSKLPQHQNRNYSIWLPMFDVAFGSYYKAGKDEYPPTGLSSGEKIDTLWEAQVGPLKAWAEAMRSSLSRNTTEKGYQ